MSEGPQFTCVSPLGLTAMVAALHVAIVAHRIFSQTSCFRPIARFVYPAPNGGTLAAAPATPRVPSKPTQTYCVGELALSTGMAIIALASWLQILHISGALGR